MTEGNLRISQQLIRSKKNKKKKLNCGALIDFL